MNRSFDINWKQKNSEKKGVKEWPNEHSMNRSGKWIAIFIGILSNERKL